MSVIRDIAQYYAYWSCSRFELIAFYICNRPIGPFESVGNEGQLEIVIDDLINFRTLVSSCMNAEATDLLKVPFCSSFLITFSMK